MLGRVALMCVLATSLTHAALVLPTDLPRDVTCPITETFCYVDAGSPGTGRSGGNGGQPPSPVGSERLCVIDRTGVVVPCTHPQWGWFYNADDCYYRVVEPPPGPDSSFWAGHHPDGAVYDVTCVDPLSAPGTNGGRTWLAAPPSGFGAPSVTPIELADRAVDQMQLVGPEIRMTGAPSEPYVVGVPLWLWTEVGARTWGPNSATASVPGLSVTATAQATRISWDMGDGNTVVCGSPGTAYYAGAPVDSPTCDYTYLRSSAGQPGDAWTITATATWEVAWSGGGTSGVLTVTRTSQTSLQVGEVQVLTSA